MSDPYQLTKESDDVPPRIRLVGGDYPQGIDPSDKPLPDRPAPAGGLEQQAV